MKALFLALLILAVVGYGLSCFFFQVEETEFTILTLFGSPKEPIKEPGLYFKWPWPVEEVIRVDRRVNITAPPEEEYLTRDKKNVLVSFFAAWKVVDPLQFVVTVNDRLGAESRIQDIIRSEVGGQLGQYELIDLLPLLAEREIEEVGASAPGGAGAPAPVFAEGLPAGGAPVPATAAAATAPESRIPTIMNTITERVQGPIRAEFGIEVVAVRMKRLNFPSQNKTNVFQRMEAERERIAGQYRSEGEELAEKLKAKADREQAKLINEANRESRCIRGEADAEAARIYAEAYSQDPQFYEFLRKLEAYEAFLNEKSTVVIPADSPLLDVLEKEE